MWPSNKPPARSFRKQKPQSTKLRTHQSDDGWSTVSRSTDGSLSARTLRNIEAAHGVKQLPTSLAKQEDASQADGLEVTSFRRDAGQQMNESDRYLVTGLTVADLTRQLLDMRDKSVVGRMQTSWKDSRLRMGLKNTLQRAGVEMWGEEELDHGSSSAKHQDKRSEIDCAICLATGSFSTERVGWNVRKRRIAMWQLILFLEMVETLTPMLRTPPVLYAQDPVFTSLDIEFLKSLSITAYTTNEAFSKATSNSFIYAPFMHMTTLYKEALLKADPVLALHNDYTETFERLCETQIRDLEDKDEQFEAKQWQVMKGQAVNYSKARSRERIPEFDEDGLQGLYMFWKTQIEP